MIMDASLSREPFNSGYASPNSQLGSALVKHTYSSWNIAIITQVLVVFYSLSLLSSHFTLMPRESSVGCVAAVQFCLYGRFLFDACISVQRQPCSMNVCTRCCGSIAASEKRVHAEACAAPQAILGGRSAPARAIKKAALRRPLQLCSGALVPSSAIFLLWAANCRADIC